jgi:hypothetical protein
MLEDHFWLIVICPISEGLYISGLFGYSSNLYWTFHKALLKTSETHSKSSRKIPELMFFPVPNRIFLKSSDSKKTLQVVASLGRYYRLVKLEHAFCFEAERYKLKVPMSSTCSVASAVGLMALPEFHQTMHRSSSHVWKIDEHIIYNI